MYPFNVCFKFVGDGEGAIGSDTDDGEVEHLIVVRVLLYHVVSQLLRTQTVWKDCGFPSMTLVPAWISPSGRSMLETFPELKRNIL